VYSRATAVEWWVLCYIDKWMGIVSAAPLAGAAPGRPGALYGVALEAVAMTDEGWFAGPNPGDEAGAGAAAVREGGAEAPDDWPARV